MAAPLAPEVQTALDALIDSGATEYPETAVLPAGALRADLEIDGEQVDVSDTSPSLRSSGAALTSTVGDVSTFFRGLFGDELVSAESVVAMQEIGVEGYGLGLLAEHRGDRFLNGT